jgi:hypothetical protein
MYLIWTLVLTAYFIFVLPDWTYRFWLWIVPFTEFGHTYYDYRYSNFKWGSRLVWPVSRGCLLLLDTLFYLRFCRRSVLLYTRFCNCLFDCGYVLHIVNLAILYYLQESISKYGYITLMIIMHDDFVDITTLHVPWLFTECRFINFSCHQHSCKNPFGCEILLCASYE